MDCLIVDDEPIARDILVNYCSHFPELRVVASLQNAIEAKRFLENHQVDVVFLDINMPVLDGISFIKSLRYRPQIVLTTAYREFAVDGFDLDVSDYLLKPFSLERFMIAVDKVKEKTNTPVTKVSEAGDASAHIFIRAEGKIYKILHKDLLYAEASGNYTKIVTSLMVLKPAMTFSAFESLLPKEDFDRIHRSFIVNKEKITHIEGNRVFIDKIEIPLGQNYREDFLKRLGL